MESKINFKEEEKTVKLTNKFMKFVKTNEIGCWDWTGCFRKHPLFHYKNTPFLATVFSYGYFIGPVTKGMYVCRNCNNSNCVNPAHLFLGTKYEFSRQDFFRNN